MNNSKGVSLLEALVASLILFFVLALLIPQLYTLSLERRNLMLDNFARKTLNEKLFMQSVKREPELNEIVLFDRVALELTIKGEASDSIPKSYRGCITWIDFFKREKQRCGIVSEW
ncbi:hypothetical protein JOC85_001634 [Bacillus mesophilus]|uniref:Type II secretion system protein n=1 Tax=Bacillus mesophilus TaxID=1808955 RepID=A0A6M0Q5L9_9BACI|nr:hypothetical protein [Bacillus mesophilus]MBM7660862.1 hypothetical protein [Bacillus mesophilus]NEY71592.1 hypothetical protein [Bacillus mesophilus]